MSASPFPPSPCFGLGLRPSHYQEIVQGAPGACGVDWFEILSENYMIPGGKPLAMLDLIRRDYPLAMHGVSLSVGTPQGPSPDYLRDLKALVERVQPLWVSDHLCWTGTHGRNMHELFPLPYSEEALAVVVRNVLRVQDYLQRPILLENVSSYVSFHADSMREWDFVAAVAERSDSLILLDVNNVYVSSVNHGFDPRSYLDALPARRVRQIHLAGHSAQDGCIIDTHDRAVADPVWALYADALRRFGPVATMIERDDNIPPLAELAAELARARRLADAVCGAAREAA
ncbi:DUF692 domain-containing protein [Janthinobacterium sp.]|uniref:MNIO family bufferin maturase n=1 Tax=Janthinobacterium sp. TaxID=1871054 RepID=UPI00293D2D53|nr:DUF692 domain-containing protein [Janthinobacterium sp.]